MNSLFKKKSILVIFSLSVVVLLGVFALQAVVPDLKLQLFGSSSQGERAPDSQNFVEGEILVVFKQGVKIAAVNAIAHSFSMNILRTYPAIAQVQGKETVHLKSSDRSTVQMIREMEKLPEVESVSPNFKRQICDTVPNDSQFTDLWGLHNTGQNGGTPDVDIDAPEAWDMTTGSSTVIVAVIDTGIEYHHPDLMANLWQNPGETPGNGIDDDGNGVIDDVYGMNAITMTGDPLDDHGHGTHCAGTIGAEGNNGTGVAGVNWSVKIIGVKFIDGSTGWGSDADAITSINYVIDLKINRGQNIVATNNSWGGPGYNAALESAVAASGTAGMVFCAAAGNDGTDNDAIPHYPCSYTCSNIISVTSVDHDGDQHHNYGATSVDIGAPGIGILSTYLGIYMAQPGDIFYDDMESGTSKWTHGGILDSWGITNAGAGGLESYWWDMSYGNFWSDSPGTGYVHNVNNDLENSSDIDLSSYSGQTVYLTWSGGFQFDWFYTNDTAKVEISNDGGITWATLWDLTSFFYGWGYYQIHQFYVIPEAYKTANFRFRFHITSDDTDHTYYGYRNKGIIIDYVGIGTDLTYTYVAWNGTSMATPHVTGVIALAASLYPSETVAQRKARILNSAAPMTSLSGKCVTGGMVNAYSALNYVQVPEINVRFGGINFADGSTKNLGTRNSSFIMGRNFTFTIDNPGGASLNLTGSPKVTLGGTHAAHFQVTQQPTSPVAPGGTTTFKLRTVRDSLPAPLPVGWEYPVSFTINIANNDSDENPYNFTIQFTLKKDT
jgi:subtilisin family serine protease